MENPPKSIVKSTQYNEIVVMMAEDTSPIGGENTHDIPNNMEIESMKELEDFQKAEQSIEKIEKQ
jgi:hypothetical protein